MRALVLDEPGRPLRETDVEPPPLEPGQVRIQVEACGVCRTDVHVRDGELPHPKLPVVLGHQIVGRIVEGGGAGARVGVPWLGWTCGACRYCTSGRENLCDRALFTGYTLDGGFAEQAVAFSDYCLPLPEGDAVALAPLLCAGLIGYRSLRMAGDPQRLGLYGFGASAHIVAQLAVADGRRVFAFTRRGDDEAGSLALELGAEWVGPSDEPGPEELDAAIIFAPAGELVPAALRATAKGGTVVCAGIHMSDIPSFPYALLWEERSVRSVANLTREDGRELFERVARTPVRTSTERFALAHAEQALDRIRAGTIRGAAVLVP